MESGDEDDLSMGRKEFEKMQKNLTKAGYREGVADGKEKHLQLYFDMSRKFISGHLWKLGTLQGFIFAEIDFKTIPLTSLIEKLLSDINSAIKEIETTKIEAKDNIDFEEFLKLTGQGWESNYEELKNRARNLIPLFDSRFKE